MRSTRSPSRSVGRSIFSRNTELWGAFGYRPADDQLRVEVSAREGIWTESFTIELADVRRAAATLLLRWAGVEVPIELRVDIGARVREQIEAAADDWGASWQGASYLLESDGELTLARKWIERSVALERNWMNVWTLAGVLERQGELDAAVEAGREALEICRAERAYCPYTRVYADELERWRSRP
jgi:tetratricopeptide (TPR) repeat protein